MAQSTTPQPLISDDEAPSSPTMSPSHFSDLAVSNIAKYHQYNCDKLLVQLASERRSFSASKRKSTSLRDALRHRGLEFEKQVVKRLKNIKDCTGIAQSEVKTLLRNVTVGTILYQLKLEVPEEFYEELGIRSVRLKSIVPDFIEVKEGDAPGEKVLMITDAKASKAAKVMHQFQVASYAYILEYITRKIRGLSISRTGGIYLPPFQLQTFRMDFLLPKIERFLTRELPQIMSIPPSKIQWHYNARCRSCEFVDTCRDDAQGSLAMIPYLSLAGAADLKYFMQEWVSTQDVQKDGLPEKNEVNTERSPNRKRTDVGDDVQIEDLADWLKELKIENESSFSTMEEVWMNKRVKNIIKYDINAKRSPYLDAVETGLAQFIGTPTASFPLVTDHNILIAMSLDPFVSRPFAWAISVYTKSGRVLPEFKHADSIPKGDESQETFVRLVENFCSNLEKVFQFMAEEKSHACIFVYSDQEKTTIQDALLEIISMDSTPEIQETQKCATRCLFNLFEDSSLLLATASGNVDAGESETIAELPGDQFPRIVIIEQAIRENIAIYVPGFYRLIDVWKQLTRPLTKDEEFKSLIDDEIENIEPEGIYESWVFENEPERTNQTHSLRLEFVNAVIASYYNLLKKYTKNPASILLFSPPEFTLTRIISFQIPYIGKLYFFKQFEAITECAQTRNLRLTDLVKFTQGEDYAGIRVNFMKFEKPDELRGKKEWIAKFELVGGGKEVSVLEPSSLKDFILVKNSQEGIAKAIQFPDIKYRNKFYGFPLSVVSIHEIDNSDPEQRTLSLKGFFRGDIKACTEYRLYRRYVDFTSDRVLRMLEEIDERGDNGTIAMSPPPVFLDLLKDPNKWGLQQLEIKELESENEKNLKLTALKLRDSFGMSPSQKEISASTLERRLQIVWGPPGSGKTHFLALYTTWYLSALHPKPSTPKSKYFIVGVTAFTRAAIDNLLTRIYRVQTQHGKIDDFTVIRMIKDASSSGRNKSKKDGVLESKADSLVKSIVSGRIDKPHRKPLVIGGTVWDWFKFRSEFNANNDWEGLDLLIIDEGSQLLVSDASIALECLNPKNGRLIVAGDHMQLGPIVQNTYPIFPEDHPLIFGSIQQCLMRREDGSVLNEDDFFLSKGQRQKRDFGPCTIQLRDNWRMNDELNSFFQKIYGDDYNARFPDIELEFDDSQLSHIENSDVRRILSPSTAITLVKLILPKTTGSSSTTRDEPYSILLPEKFLQAEADVVYQISRGYLDAPRDNSKNTGRRPPSLFIVTPHHRQRLTIQAQLAEYLNRTDINVQINTVEKMQGQESDLVIACFGFFDAYEISREYEFLFDRNRWNVAISRSRAKVIVITTPAVLYPKGMEIFSSKKTSEGWVFLSMIEKWVSDRAASKGKKKKGINDDDYSGIIEWVLNVDKIPKATASFKKYTSDDSVTPTTSKTPKSTPTRFVGIDTPTLASPGGSSKRRGSTNNNNTKGKNTIKKDKTQTTIFNYFSPVKKDNNTADTSSSAAKVTTTTMTSGSRQPPTPTPTPRSQQGDAPESPIVINDSDSG